VLGLCLDPHDLAIAKYVAGGDKDLLFNRQLILRGLLDQKRLLQLLEATAIDSDRSMDIAGRIASDFHDPAWSGDL
jgi:hypothetical protein